MYFIGLPPKLTARHRAHDEKWLGSLRNCLGERRVRRIMGEILLNREESHQRSPLPGDVVPDGAPQHGIGGLERVEHRALGDRTFDLKFDLSSRLRQGPQM